MTNSIDILDLIERLRFLPEEPAFPHQDFEDAIKVQAEITPILIEELKDVSEHLDIFNAEIDEALPLYAMVLLGKFRCQEAFPVILEVLKQNPEWIDDYFSFFLTQGLSNVLASTYNGDLQLLTDFILNDEVEEWARVAGSSCLLTLTVHGNMSRDTFHKTYLHLLDNIDYEEFIDLFESTVEDAIEVYPEGELAQKIETILKNHTLNKRMELPEQLVEVRKKGMIAQYRELRESTWQGFVDDIEELIGWMAFYHEDYDDEDDHPFYEDELYDSDITSPIVSYEEKVGRNDPCPCGSGKKYKKCCAKV